MDAFLTSTTLLLITLALPHAATATQPPLAETTGTTPPGSGKDWVPISSDRPFPARALGSDRYAVRTNTPLLKFLCSVERRKSPLKWFRTTDDNERIDLANVDYATQETRVAGNFTSFILSVKNFTKELAGMYSCEAHIGSKIVGSRDWIMGVDDGPSEPKNIDSETFPTTGNTPSA
ncbi:hypothetical protein AAVH_17027 [Aphelenchoides avenae]|nr:hypothetical protein AAVH_17027 [Aphelenchus avenae]